MQQPQLDSSYESRCCSPKGASEHFAVVQSLSRVQLFATPGTAAHQASLSSTVSSSVQFSPSVVSNSLWPHGLQHARPPCPSPTPRVYSNSCPLSRWCHPAISSPVIPFSRSSVSRNLLKHMSMELVMLSNHSSSATPSPPVLNLSQHHGLFQQVGSSHQVAKVLEFQLQQQSFQWILRADFL